MYINYFCVIFRNIRLHGTRGNTMWTLQWKLWCIQFWNHTERAINWKLPLCWDRIWSHQGIYT